MAMTVKGYVVDKIEDKTHIDIKIKNMMDLKPEVSDFL